MDADNKSNPDRPKSRLQIRLPSKQNEKPVTVNKPKQPAQQPPQPQQSKQQSQAQQQQQKPWPKYSPKPPNFKAPFATTDQNHLHHQSTSLHFLYRNGKWSFQGETTLYLSHVPEPDETLNPHGSNSKTNANPTTKSSATAMREIALHFRGGDRMHITKAAVHVPLPNQTNISLSSIRADVVHHDPISKVLTKPAQTFTPKEFYPPVLGARTSKSSAFSTPGRRYEADTQCTRGGGGMMEALRCASIASNSGELRLRFVCPRANVAGTEVLKNIWREELLKSDGQDCDGSLEKELKSADHKRGVGRRQKRLDLIVNKMVQENPPDKNAESSNTGSASSSAKNRESEHAKDKSIAAKTSMSTNGTSTAMGLKVVIQFYMEEVDSLHLGGIHFQAPTVVNGNPQLQTSTPHVYTTSGVIGDHQGVRSWVPTIDSASSKHRSSHELTVAITADSREGLWAAGCGEHFGVSKTVLHNIPNCNQGSDGKVVLGSKSDLEPSPIVRSEPVPFGQECTGADKELLMVLGKRKLDFLVQQFREDPIQNKVDLGNDGNKVHLIPPENAADASSICQGPLATAIWTTSIWSPCPSRSLSFAIGPFCVIYDPEYYGKDDSDHEDGQDSDEEEEEEEDYPTINETAKEHGEGIRQLYFALRDERQYIHSTAIVIGDVGAIRYAPFNVSDSEESKGVVLSIMGSTAGVPNRALSLMRDILSLPSYRTMSYTQIWIPDAVDGGVSSGSFHSCPEVSCNSFLGGTILDSKLLHPVGQRLPFFGGGRVLQFAQARCAIRGWIISALPLGGSDDVGHSYLHALIESLIMSLYERAHGAFGEGGSRHSFFFSTRYAISSGLNSKNMDFLPFTNVEEEDIAFAVGPGFGGVGALPADERGKEQLWRNADNGEESHTSTLDEFSIRQLLSKDFLEGIERVEKSLPSMGWLGSLLSMSFLTSNSTSSSKVGCGAVELLHPVGGVVYRHLKSKSLSKIIEGRSGLSNFIRVMRAAFIAGILEDKGATQVDLPSETNIKVKDKKNRVSSNIPEKPKPLFVICVDELVKKGGIAHGSFIRSLRILSGIREPYLRGDLIDCSRKARGAIPSQPEGFPNSFVRGSCGLYLRVGAHVESAALGDQQNVKNLQVFILAEPVIPEGGIAFGGPVTVRIIERGGQCRDFVKVIESDGSRSDWGPITLYGEPVASVKSQVAASGTIEAAQSAKKGASGRIITQNNSAKMKKTSLFGSLSIANQTAFDENILHRGGYQALELIRLTNRTPLLWVKVDPHGVFDGRIALFQQDACLGEQLFHDGDAVSQVEALRALAERPLRLQGAPKVKSLYDVPVEELPVHLLGDCLRGSAALHADLPHNPAIRAQAALAIGQWQNNKAPNTKNSVGWIGLQLLVQYVNERFFKNGSITCAKFTRLCLRSTNNFQSNSNNSSSHTAADPDQYHYLDNFDEEERMSAIEHAYSTEREEDEEYRVRSAVVTAIASVRAMDGMSPPLVLDVLHKILQSDDESSPVTLHNIEEERLIHNKKRRKENNDESNNETSYRQRLFQDIGDIPYSSSIIIADALLALCHINARPDLVDDPVTGKQVQSSADHPCIPLMESCYRWLQWDLYKETIQIEKQMKQLSPIGRVSSIAPCAITALYSLALLRQSTTDVNVDLAAKNVGSSEQKRRRNDIAKLIEIASTTDFYVEIFDTKPQRPDSTRAAAAQAVLCLCCAGDRNDAVEPVGLLKGLEFVLNRILEPSTSPGLRQTLALLMLDASTGKICSTQRIASISKSNDLMECGARMYNGPLGASYGGENGASIHTSVAAHSMPAADAVNNGARRGLRLLKQAGKPDVARLSTIVRVASFATRLWRTINGELGVGNINPKVGGITPIISAVDGICAHDGHLRCTLLSLWQWLYPKACIAVLRIQHEGGDRCIGANEVMMIDESEKEAATTEEGFCAHLRTRTKYEIDRQRWRGEMAEVRRKEVASLKDASTNSQGLNFPLKSIFKDEAWKQGGWVASASSQRRKEGSDGGSSVSVTKFRLSVSGRD